MPEEKLTEGQVRLNAPTYMRPQHPVLDAPLDINFGKRVAPPKEQTHFEKEDVDDPKAFSAQPPLAEGLPVAKMNVDVAEATSLTEESIVATVGSVTPVQDNSISVVENEPEVETALEPAEEIQTSEKPKRKGMNVFQQWIVFLLLLLVTSILATIYLYTHGWIELPPVVLEAIEKGLSLIR